MIKFGAMLKRLYLLFFFSSLFLGHSNAQFLDMESWGLVELIQYGSDVYQFKYRDSSVSRITLYDKRFGDKMVWKYNAGKLVSYSQKSKLDDDKEIMIFQHQGKIDSVIQMRVGDWVDLVFYSYDSTGVLLKVGGKSQHRKKPYLTTGKYLVDINFQKGMMLMYGTVTKPFYIDTVLAVDVLQSNDYRSVLKKDSISDNKLTTYRKHFGCNYTEQDHMLAHLQKPMRSCPDSLLFTEVITVNGKGILKSVEIISEEPKAQQYTMYFDYNEKGFLSRIFTHREGVEEELYKLKYKY